MSNDANADAKRVLETVERAQQPWQRPEDAQRLSNQAAALMRQGIKAHGQDNFAKALEYEDQGYLPHMDLEDHPDVDFTDDKRADGTHTWNFKTKHQTSFYGVPKEESESPPPREERPDLGSESLNEAYDYASRGRYRPRKP